MTGHAPDPTAPPADLAPEDRRSSYLFHLPPESIAQMPEDRRDHSRMMVVDRAAGTRRHAVFSELPGFLRPGDVLALNDTRVIPARLFGRRVGGTAQVEVLLLRRIESNFWKAMVRPGRKMTRGRTVRFGDGSEATVVSHEEDGTRILRFDIHEDSMDAFLSRQGITPLPPYIHRVGAAGEDFHRERYQTVYARLPGSVAAPTAGLHFTPEVLADLERRGVQTARVTLHVGMGTFRPVETEDVRQHRMDEEFYTVEPAEAERIDAARREGRRVVAVGTTVTRTLESVAQANEGRVVAGGGSTRLFIRPGFPFRVIGGLLTNFHLPGSTLIMLVSALAGRKQTLAHYEEAVRSGYRFYSYGDCMLIL